MVAGEALIYHPTVAHYLRFVATTVGRDKLLRTVQYFARFYSWYLYRTNAFTASIQPWEVLKKQFGLIRKTLRVGKSIEHIKAAAAVWDAKGTDPVLQYLAVGRQLSYATYLTFDTLTWLDALGIRPNPSAKRLQREAFKGWMTGLMFSTISSLYTLWQLRQREQGIDKKDGEGVVEAKKIQRERNATSLQLTTDLADLVIPTAALGIVGFDEGIVGLAGTLSSLVGVYSQWKKTA